MPEIFFGSKSVSHTLLELFLPGFGRITRRTRRRCSVMYLEYIPSRRLACGFVLHPESGQKRRERGAGVCRALLVRSLGRVRSAHSCALSPVCGNVKTVSIGFCLHTLIASGSPNRILKTTIRAVPKGGAPQGASIGVYGAQGFRQTDWNPKGEAAQTPPREIWWNFAPRIKTPVPAADNCQAAASDPGWRLCVFRRFIIDNAYDAVYGNNDADGAVTRNAVRCKVVGYFR